MNLIKKSTNYLYSELNKKLMHVLWEWGIKKITLVFSFFSDKFKRLKALSNVFGVIEGSKARERFNRSLHKALSNHVFDFSLMWCGNQDIVVYKLWGYGIYMLCFLQSTIVFYSTNHRPIIIWCYL